MALSRFSFWLRTRAAGAPATYRLLGVRVPGPSSRMRGHCGREARWAGPPEDASRTSPSDVPFEGVARRRSSEVAGDLPYGRREDRIVRNRPNSRSYDPFRGRRTRCFGSPWMAPGDAAEPDCRRKVTDHRKWRSKRGLISRLAMICALHTPLLNKSLWRGAAGQGYLSSRQEGEPYA